MSVRLSRQSDASSEWWRPSIRAEIAERSARWLLPTAVAAAAAAAVVVAGGWSKLPVFKRVSQRVLDTVEGDEEVCAHRGREGPVRRVRHRIEDACSACAAMSDELV